MIAYDNVKQIFHLRSQEMSYHIDGKKGLRNLYFGKEIDQEDAFLLRQETFHSSFDQDTGLEREEYPCSNGHSYTRSCLQMQWEDCRGVILRMMGHEIREEDGKEELVIRLADQQDKTEVCLRYALYPGYPLIRRSAVIYAKKPVTLTAAHSASMNLPERPEFNIMYTTGKWSGEWQPEQMPFTTGIHTLHSLRGITGPHFNPSLAVCTPDTNESSGEVWFSLLGYSGNWAAHAEKTIFGNAHVIMGIQDMDFKWNLAAGEKFETPPVYMGYTDGGFGEMSRILHQFIREHILPAQRPRQVLYNSWEATAFQVDVEKQKELARKAADIGCELFVLDDGWFGERNHDQAGLGDWTVNKKKFPAGLPELIRYVKEHGMKFGIWLEPEAVNPDSELYRKHPKWIYRQPGIKPITARNQYVLNITLPQVQEYLKESIGTLLRDNDISFIKWDMNRGISDIGSCDKKEPGSLWHSHVKALYDIWAYLRQEFPSIELETCAGGGGRVDLGILKLADQCWPSDNTDPSDRLLIQNGFTHFYPPAVMMSWVTESGQALRKGAFSLKYRFYSAMCGGLAIGADISKFTPAELAECRKYISQYKEWRSIIQTGRLYRLLPPGKGLMSAVEYISCDGREAVVFAFLGENHFGDAIERVRMQGLEASAKYQVNELPELISGSYLERIGLPTGMSGNYDCCCFYLKRLE